MNKFSAGLGTVLVVIAAFLFLIVFSGGSLGNFVITGANPTTNFLAFLYVIVALPVGAGLAFYGYSVRRPIFAAGSASQVVYKRSSIATVALVIAIIAIILGGAGVFYASTVTPPSNAGVNTSLANLQAQLNSLNTQVTGLQSKVSSVNGTVGALQTVNVAPTIVPFRVDWCNTDNTGEDRFCPQNIVVNQGDIVQILFMHNDTDAHTFTMLPFGTQGYSFQINLTYGAPGETKLSGTFYANGMHNFLTDGNFTGSCVNTDTYAGETTAISGSDCVSGKSLNIAGAQYGIAINPIPKNVCTPANNCPALITVTNQAFFPNINISAAIAGIKTPIGTTGAEAWGIGAFNATSPGIYEYFCHYHVSNGMFGYIIVLPNSYCYQSSTNAKTCGLKG